MVKNEDPSGLNPYSGGHPNIAKELVERKRDLERERKISPRQFNATHRTSSRHDDKVVSKSLNSFNGKQLAQMLFNKSSKNDAEFKMDFTLMNEQETINAIQEEVRIPKTAMNSSQIANARKQTDLIFE